MEKNLKQKIINKIIDENELSELMERLNIDHEVLTDLVEGKLKELREDKLLEFI